MTTWPPADRTVPTAQQGGRDRVAGAGKHRLPLVGVLMLVAVMLAVIGPLAWRATGGRWAVVETGSMGTAVPVGSLIVIGPRPLDDIRVGDVVTYRPPHLRSMYTHRVVAVDPGGSLRVQGDANATPDPWPVTQDMLVGKVVEHVRGLGWAVRALPLVVLGLVVLHLAANLWAPPRWRSSARVLGTCLVFAVASLLLRPFVHPVLVATTTDTDGVTTRATVASTGMFPTRISGAPGQHVDLLSGQIGSVIVNTPAPGGPIMVDGSAHLTGWWLVGVGGVCLLPLLWVLVVGLVPAPRHDTAGGETR